MDELKIKMYSYMIDCVNPKKLAEFYASLLSWDVMFIGDDYAIIGAPDTMQGAYPCMGFQRNDDYVPPVWPEQPDKQQQMAHIDFAVNDIDRAVEHAISCGAKQADTQFDEHWRVMRDPDGHPFCLCGMSHVFDSEHFGLL